MVDWYMFGWSSAIVSTGMSYVQSGLKRQGYAFAGASSNGVVLSKEDGKEVVRCGSVLTSARLDCCKMMDDGCIFANNGWTS